jgi:hypothetical protein
MTKKNACGWQREGMATLDVLQQRPELLLWLTKTLAQGLQAAVDTAYAGGVAAGVEVGVAEEKARAAAALG